MAMKQLGAAPQLPNDVANYGTTNGPTGAHIKGLALKNRLDPRLSLYNWQANNTRRIRLSLARAARGGYDSWLVIGDSLTAGCNNSVSGPQVYDRTNTYTQQLSRILAASGIPRNGSGLTRSSDAGLTDPQRYTYSANWANSGTYGYFYTQTVGSTATFKPAADENGSTFVFNTLSGSTYGGATYQISVNGTVVRTLTTSTSGASLWLNYKVPNLKIVGGVTQVTVTVTGVPSGGSGFIAGAGVETPNGGLSITNIGQSGATAGGTGAASWSDMTNGSLPILKYSAGYAISVTDGATTSGSTTYSSASSGFTTDNIGMPIETYNNSSLVIPENTYIQSIISSTSVQMSNAALQTASSLTVRYGRDPSLVLIMLGANDVQYGITPAACASGIQSIAAQFPNSDIMLMINHEGAYTFNSGASSQANQDAIAQALYTLADTMNWPLLDMRDRIGRYADLYATGIISDGAHLNTLGYSLYAEAIAQAVMSGGGGNRMQQNAVPVYDNDVTNKLYVDNAANGLLLSTGTTLTTAVAQTWHRIDTTSATVNATLPAAPPDRTEIVLENAGTAANILTYVRGGSTDTIEGNTTSYTLQANEWVELTYRASNTTWYQRRFLSVPTAGTNMRRDLNGRSQVVAPAVAADIVNKAYVDVLGQPSYTPASGDYTMPSTVLSTGASAATSGQATFMPLDISAASTGWTPQSLNVNVTTAQVAGTGTLVKQALYADRGDGGGPLLTSAGLLFQNTVTATSTGIKAGTYTTKLNPGRYWTCFFYYAGSVAPTTIPQFTAVNTGTSLYAPVGAPFNVTRYLRVTGLTDLPTASQALISGTDATGTIVSVRRA